MRKSSLLRFLQFGVLVSTRSVALIDPIIEHPQTLETRTSCNVNDALLTKSGSSPLPPPSDGLEVKHVAIGRGTQNYTCASNKATDIPASSGALARLFDASCIAVKDPLMLAQLPGFALLTDLQNKRADTLTFSRLRASGVHYFPNPQTPIFDLHTAAIDLGRVSPKKTNASPPPKNAIIGKNNKGNGAVPWLKLVTSDNEAGKLKEVYRVNTAGGNPPKTCEKMPTSFEVDYAAEYWFYGKSGQKHDENNAGDNVKDDEIAIEDKKRAKKSIASEDFLNFFEEAVESEKILKQEEGSI